MVDFNLIKKEPNALELRGYLFQILASPFGLAESTEEHLKEKFPGFEINSIEEINDNEIRTVLKDLDLLPDFIFYFKNDKNNNSKDYKQFPELFTHIQQVSFDNGGLIVLEHFCSQIYKLFNSLGEELTGFCHDLDLGTNGKIIYRLSDGQFWEEEIYKGSQLIELHSHFDYPNDFPHIYDRDIIEEMFPLNEFPKLDEDLTNLTNDQVGNYLKHNKDAFRFLVKYYENNKDLAIHAVRSNVSAFTLLAKNLQEDKEFVIQLLHQEKLSHIYNYLNDSLKKDKDIIELCLHSIPGILKHIAPVADKELLIKAVKIDKEVYKYASDELKVDKKLILELVKEDWMILRDAPEKLLNDRDFILTAINSYNENIREQERNNENHILPWDPESRLIDLNKVVNYLIGFNHPHLMKLISPVKDIDLALKGLSYSSFEDIPVTLIYISEELINEREFWLKAVKINSQVIKYLPSEFNKDKEIALTSVKEFSESIEFIDDSLKNDPEIINLLQKRESNSDELIEGDLPF